MADTTQSTSYLHEVPSVGQRLTMIVHVSMERRSESLDNFKKAVLAAPEVQQCYYLTGSADFLLILTAKDLNDYEMFTRRFFFKNSNVIHFVTNVVVDHVKVGMAIPIEADE